MTDVIYYEDFEGFELAEIDSVSVEQFVAVIENLKESMELDEGIHFKDIDGCLTTIITYRDSANYKYPFALQLNGGGEVLIVEPEWFGDEEEEKDLFWSIIREHFAPTC